FGLMIIAIREAFGAISHNSPNFFASRIDVAVIRPVTLPPGRLKLATRPDLTGSLLVMIKIGIVDVALLAASAPISPPPARITWARRCTRLEAKAGSWAYSPRAHRYSIATF